MKRLLTTSILAILLFAMIAPINAQEYPILWEDHFDDDEVAPLTDVGWIFYPAQDVQNQTIEQRDGALFVQAGSYGGLVGVGLVESNGVPTLTLDENGNIDDASVERAKQNSWGSPNQILTFQVNCKRFTSSMLVVGARMPMDEKRGDADPTEASTYALVLNPLADQTAVAKYEGAMAALNPDSWNYFAAPTDFDFDLDVFYWVKWYLNEGDIKVKIWEGFEEDEPEEWLIEAVDAEPRVTGTYNMFATFGSAPATDAGDQFIIDDVVVRSSVPGGTAVEEEVAVATDFNLKQNYPNPFNPTTNIAFTLPATEMTKLVVYNLQGQAIRTLANSEMPAGNYELTWDGKDDNARSVASGIYIYQLTSGSQKISKRMVMMK